ncbi:hypothetical protein [Rhodococcus artemisiae]|uniref:Uncharacterized protein n=1 Tax=Rhodococcus artemisiae TaxID=714159 RepID=A0ABU7LFT9_9NOCA|nr:hypothetical protein [Rhodococcus artemisiae]MEE2060408.1 hypothetical protein [Rhodococcus artemisiae]
MCAHRWWRAATQKIEDGQPLDQPRLVVPSDVHGGCYVSDLIELRIVDLGGARIDRSSTG